MVNQSFMETLNVDSKYFAHFDMETTSWMIEEEVLYTPCMAEFLNTVYAKKSRKGQS